MRAHQNTWRACVYISLQCWYWLLLGLLLRFMLLDSWVHISAQHMWWRICQWRSVEKLASFHIYNPAAIVENHLLTNLSEDWLYTTMGHWRLSCIIERPIKGYHERESFWCQNVYYLSNWWQSNWSCESICDALQYQILNKINLDVSGLWA